MSAATRQLDAAWGTPRRRTVTLYDPAIFATAAELPGRQLLQAIVEGRLPPPPIAKSRRRSTRLRRRR